MSSTSKELVQHLQQELINKAKTILASYDSDPQELVLVQFKTRFQIRISEGAFDDYVLVSYPATGILQDGTILYDSDTSSGEEVPIDQLDIYEIAHICDLLETQEALV